MATIDETLGQTISEEIEKEEDQISRQGGVGISLEDFTSSGVKIKSDEEDDRDGLTKPTDQETDETQLANTVIDELNQNYDLTQTVVDANIINDLANGAISDIDLLISMDKDIDIIQLETFNNDTRTALGIQDNPISDGTIVPTNETTLTNTTVGTVGNTIEPTDTPIEQNIPITDDTTSAAPTAVEGVTTTATTISFDATDIDTSSVNTSLTSTNGSAIINANGQIVFTPEDGFTGEATIAVETTDEDGNTVTQEFTVVVPDNIEDTTVLQQPVVTVVLTDIQSSLITVDQTPPDAPVISFESTG
ncbi:MAG: Ig-like domain-containing protein, partial [Campylobacterales bacterium]|nr:Ig-like domain-containing protein [Campylobacterales bacterium]